MNRFKNLYNSLSESERESVPIEQLNEQDSEAVRETLMGHFSGANPIDEFFVLFLVTKFRTIKKPSNRIEKPQHLKRYEAGSNPKRDFLAEFNSIPKENMDNYPLEYLNFEDETVWINLIYEHFEGINPLSNEFFSFLFKKFTIVTR